jgi:hypothetical protein
LNLGDPCARQPDPLGSLFGNDFILRYGVQFRRCCQQGQHRGSGKKMSNSHKFALVSLCLCSGNLCSVKRSVESGRFWEIRPSFHDNLKPVQMHVLADIFWIIKIATGFGWLNKP